MYTCALGEAEWPWSTLASLKMQRDCCPPRPCSQTLATYITSQVGHSTTASAHRIPRDTCPDASLWEFYWVHDYLSSYQPDTLWRLTTLGNFIKLTDFPSNAHHYFPHQCQRPLLVLSIIWKHRKALSDAPPMQQLWFAITQYQYWCLRWGPSLFMPHVAVVLQLTTMTQQWPSNPFYYSYYP